MRAKLPTKGLMAIGETCIQGTCPIQIFSCYPNTIFLSPGGFDALWLLVYLRPSVILQKDTGYWILDSGQAFLPFEGPRGGGGGSLETPFMISGTIKASPMKLCTVIVLLKAYQNTKINFKKYDL